MTFRLQVLTFALISTLLLNGCVHRNIGSNNLPIVVDHAELLAVKAKIDDYRKPNVTVTQQQRNELVERLIGISDDHYFQMRKDLLKSRNTLTFAGQVASTTLSAVSALLGDADTKSILSTASALTQSTTASIDKTWFNQTSTQALVNKMDAQRATFRQGIVQNESKDLTQYSFEAALNDVRLYDQAGTLTSALLAINSDTGKQNQLAQEQLQQRLSSR